MADWYSEDNLKIAWKYARIDLRDDFVFDVIGYEDILHNIDLVIRSLHSQIQEDQYYPAPLLRVDVPKNEHSCRPGTTVMPVDLIGLYALAQQLVPMLDPLLSDSARAYRLNPKSSKSGQPLLASKNEQGGQDKVETQVAIAEAAATTEEDSEQDTGAEFPYDWFANWLPFHQQSMAAAEKHEYAAVTDITAFFENIPLNLLRESLKEKLNTQQRTLIDRMFRLLEFWDWNPSGNLPRAIGLPQGNDVSSFLANVYLADLDNAMLDIVGGDTSKYYRYVDDTKVYTDDRDEARRALVTLEQVLRTLGLNTQSAKTKILAADEIFDEEVEIWLQKMRDDADDKHQAAHEFFDGILDFAELSKWQRPYLRCLTVLKNATDDLAIDATLEVFLQNPSHKVLNKTFDYLRHFIQSHAYGVRISQRLASDTFTFPFHEAYMLRLGAISRDDCTELKQLALQIAIEPQKHWFTRMAALQCLDTYPLSGNELNKIENIVKNGAHPQVMRAAFIALCQHSGPELRWVLDRISLFNAPHQDYLRRYFFQLYRDSETAQKYLNRFASASLNAPAFVDHLHRLDLLKARSDPQVRELFHQTLTEKIDETQKADWPRLTNRLQAIHSAFVTNSSS